MPQVLSLRGQVFVTLLLKFCRFAVKMPVGIPQDLWLRGQDPGWDTSNFVASLSRCRLGCLKFYGFVVKTPVEISQILRLRGQDPSRDTASVEGSWSRSRPGYLKFCGISRYRKFIDFIIKIPLWIFQLLSIRGQYHGLDTSRSRLGYLKYCDFVIQIEISIPQILWFRRIPQVWGIMDKTPTRIPQVWWPTWSRPRLGFSSVMAS